MCASEAVCEIDAPQKPPQLSEPAVAAAAAAVQEEAAVAAAAAAAAVVEVASAAAAAAAVVAVAVAVLKEAEKSPRELPESLPSLPRLRSEDQLDPPTAAYELFLFLFLVWMLLILVRVVASSTAVGQHSGFELNTIRLAGAASSPRGRRRAVGCCERRLKAGESDDRPEAASGRGGVPSKVMSSQA